jgi:hypothetical protein
MIEEIKQWAQVFVKDAAERKVSADTMALIQMELADLQFILAKYENKREK